MGWSRCFGGILLILTLTETGAIDRGILEKECDRIEVKEESGLVSSYQFFDGSIESIEKICGEGLHQDEEKTFEPVYSLKAGYDLNDPSRNFDYVMGIGLNAWQAISIPRYCQETSRVRTDWDGCVANPYIVELMESNENRKLKENSTLSIWFKWTDFGGGTTMLAMHGTDEEGGDLVVRLKVIDEKTIAFSHQYSGEPEAKFKTQSNSKLTDIGWHHVVLDDRALLLDGSRHLWTKDDANSPGFGQFDMNEVVLGGDIVEWDAGTGYKKYIRKGGFDFWGLRIFDYSMTDCEMGLLHEADFQVVHSIYPFSFSIRNSPTGAMIVYWGVECFVQLMKPGGVYQELVKLGMIRKWSSVESWMSQGQDELSLAWIRFGTFAMIGGTTEEAAEIHNGTLTEAMYYCSGVTLPSNCLWSSKCIPETIDSASSTPTVTFLPPPPPPPRKTQSQINRAQEASTATTVAATSVAVTSVASVASSAATSAAISNAGTALMSSGGSQLGSVAGGVAGVGVMSVVAQLQFFNLQSQLSVNLSEKYTNMADALKWVNFEMDVGLGSQASSLEQRRRRLLGWRESVQNGLDVSQEAWARGAARLTIIAVLFVLVICVHMAILKLWGCLRPLKKRPLPASLVFPRIELLFCSATYLSIAESVGLLLASQKQVAVYAGLLAFLYLGLLTGGVYLAIRQTLWRCHDHGVPFYERVRPGADCDTQAATRCQWLLSRMDGQWGHDIKDLIKSEEPKRTQHYLRTGISVWSVLKLMRRVNVIIGDTRSTVSNNPTFSTSAPPLPSNKDALRLQGVEKKLESNVKKGTKIAAKKEPVRIKVHPQEETALITPRLEEKQSSADDEISLLRIELKERLGLLFEEYKGSTKVLSGFFLVDLLFKFLLAINVGVVAGRGVRPFSTGARISLWCSLLVQLLFAVMLTWFRPHIDKFKGFAHTASVWLQTAALGCAVMIKETSGESIKEAMFFLEVGSVLIQLTSVWILTLLKLLASVGIRRKVDAVVNEYDEAKRLEQEAQSIAPHPIPASFPNATQEKQRPPPEPEPASPRDDCAQSSPREKKANPAKPKTLWQRTERTWAATGVWK